MRRRLAFLIHLLSDIGDAVRGRTAAREPQERPRPAAGAAGERRSADEVKQRLDESRERLKRDIPEPQD